jgi:opacity protein-like surface antigen
MKLFVMVGAVASLMALSTSVAPADDVGKEIDLTTFGATDAERASVWDDYDIENVGLLDRGNAASRRIYLSGMIGPNFVTSGFPDDPALDATDTVFAAGGAIGVAFERQRGRLRLELEGIGRNDFFGPYADGSGGAIARSNWSVMQNVWRDFMFTDRFGAYGGGGLGGGGYRDGELLSGNVSVDRSATTFAWQFGGGLLYEISDRVTFDVGYRYFQIDDIFNIADFPVRYSASELMFTLRLYEPFRRWWN